MGTGTRIRQLRLEELGLTQRQLAAKLGVDPITVSRWERGTIPAPLNRVRLAQLAGLHPNWLLDSDEEAA